MITQNELRTSASNHAKRPAVARLWPKINATDNLRGPAMRNGRCRKRDRYGHLKVPADPYNVAGFHLRAFLSEGVD